MQHAIELRGGNGVMLDSGVETSTRDAAQLLHRKATVDISRFTIVKASSPDAAGRPAGPEN